MTTRAKRVLDDCRIALQLLEEEKDLRRWRIHWVAALALIRAVGHVLDKIDGADARIGAAAKAAYGRWRSDAPQHEIFREFIERERNTILKQYEFNTHPHDQVELVLLSNLRRSPDGETIREAQIAPIGDNIYRPLLGGFRKGDDARDVLSDAIDWWEGELAAIEDSLKGRAKD